MPRDLPPPEMLRKLLRYEPETGKLFWRSRPVGMFPDQRAEKIWNTRYAGREAFTADNGNGYRVGAIFNVLYQAHRVIWAMVTGAWPVGQIDHINGDRSDKNHNLGLFSDFSHAVAARKAAEVEFGFHENHGAALAAHNQHRSNP